MSAASARGYKAVGWQRQIGADSCAIRVSQYESECIVQYLNFDSVLALIFRVFRSLLSTG